MYVFSALMPVVRGATVVLWGSMLWAGAVSAALASGVWVFEDTEGVTHLGNTAPPTARGVQWLSRGVASRAPQIISGAGTFPVAKMAGYAQAKPMLEDAAQDHAVDPALVTAVSAAESGFRPDAVSPKGAVGLMQLMPATAERYGVVAPNRHEATKLLKDPRLNAQVGTRYLADLIRMFNGDLELVLAAYNAGEGAVMKHGRRIPPYPETQQYVVKVLKYYRSMRS
ncbi:lytic transglycosylase domain-containing protein [Hydrogenophaga atypica]|uniref:Lytic transglycosylase domain-containing protein n=1 Tax=Hydrogenophaga atypica TaxID=249409 RepID=A0ABW2QFF0_9BURK